MHELRKWIQLKFLNRDRRQREFRKELSFLFNSLPTLETAQAKVGSSGWKSTAHHVVSGAFPAALENLEDRVPLTPGRTHNHIRSPSQTFIVTLLFDPSMSALPIIVKQNSPSVGLFTHQ
ncbi:unnamed protein product [Brassica oleracea]